MRKFQITVNGTAYEVEVEEIGAGASVAPVAAPAAPAAAPAAPAAKAPEGFVAASPRAKHLAAELGIDYEDESVVMDRSGRVVKQ